MLAPDRQGLTLILSRVINTLNSTLASSNRLPPRCPYAIYWVLAATRFDTLVPMPLVFFYSCHDFLSTLVCAEVYQPNFSHPRNRSGRICSHSLLRSSAACTESAAHISTICRKVAPRLSQCGWVEEPSSARRRPPSGAAEWKGQRAKRAALATYRHEAKAPSAIPCGFCRAPDGDRVTRLFLRALRSRQNHLWRKQPDPADPSIY